MIKLLADENIHLRIIKELRNLGIITLFVPDIGLSGKSDDIILEYAINNNLILITGDKDFGGLIEFGILWGKGKVILLNFWTTTIQPCKDLLPELQKLFGKFPSDRIAMFGINMDQSVNGIKPFIEKLQLSFPVLIADNKVTKDYGVGAVPQTVLIDKKGIVKKIYVGYAAGDEKEYLTAVEALIRDEE